MLKIQTEDVYDDMRRNAGQYDTRNYPKDHPLFSTANKKVLGKMKDEYAGVPIVEFVGLRPKMYTILKVDGLEERKAKGVKKAVVEKHIRYAQYNEALRAQRIRGRHFLFLCLKYGHREAGTAGEGIRNAFVEELLHG